MDYISFFIVLLVTSTWAQQEACSDVGCTSDFKGQCFKEIQPDMECEMSENLCRPSGQTGGSKAFKLPVLAKMNKHCTSAKGTRPNFCRVRDMLRGQIAQPLQRFCTILRIHKRLSFERFMPGPSA